jgi:hypothetical protein
LFPQGSKKPLLYGATRSSPERCTPSDLGTPTAASTSRPTAEPARHHSPTPEHRPACPRSARSRIDRGGDHDLKGPSAHRAGRAQTSADRVVFTVARGSVFIDQDSSPYISRGTSLGPASATRGPRGREAVARVPTDQVLPPPLGAEPLACAMVIEECGEPTSPRGRLPE